MVKAGDWKQRLSILTKNNQAKLSKNGSKKRIFKIQPENQSESTRNLNMRKNRIGQMLQKDREQSFPHYYESKGKFLCQQRI